MPPGYRAGPGSGMFGSYAQPDSRPRVDVGSALDAIGNTATSLIQQAYTRKLGQQQFALEQQRVADERNYRDQTLAFQKTNADREYSLNQQRAERESASAMATLLPQGYAFDDSPTLTESAYNAGAPTQAGAPAAAASVRPARNILNDAPGVHASIESAYGAPIAPTAASAPAPAPAPTPAAPSAPAITIGGRRLVYKGYGASAQGQAEKQRETFETSQQQLTQAFQTQMEKAKAGDERALENLKFMHEQNLIPVKAKAEADAFLNKQQFGTPNQDETIAATQLPEMIKAHQIMGELGQPQALTTLTQKHGGSLAKAIQSPEGQRFLQASKQFSVTGTLATEGARFSPEKQKASDDMFIPTNWNDPATLTQIANSRKQRILDAAQKSGRAFNNLPLETQQYLVDSLGYRPIRGQNYTAQPGATGAPPAAAVAADATPAPRRVGVPAKAAPAPVAANDYVSKYGLTPSDSAAAPGPAPVAAPASAAASPHVDSVLSTTANPFAATASPFPAPAPAPANAPPAAPAPAPAPARVVSPLAGLQNQLRTASKAVDAERAAQALLEQGANLDTVVALIPANFRSLLAPRLAAYTPMSAGGPALPRRRVGAPARLDSVLSPTAPPFTPAPRGR